MLIFCFGNNQANSSFVGSLRKVLCPGGGECWQTTFIKGNRNAFISKRAPSLRVRVKSSDLLSLGIVWVFLPLLKASTRGQSADYLGCKHMHGELERAPPNSGTASQGSVCSLAEALWSERFSKGFF